MFEGHDPYLVALSVVIAILGGYTGFGLAARIRATPGVSRRVLLAGAAGFPRDRHLDHAFHRHAGRADPGRYRLSRASHHYLVPDLRAGGRHIAVFRQHRRAVAAACGLPRRCCWGSVSPACIMSACTASPAILRCSTTSRWCCCRCWWRSSRPMAACARSLPGRAAPVDREFDRVRRRGIGHALYRHVRRAFRPDRPRSHHHAGRARRVAAGSVAGGGAVLFCDRGRLPAVAGARPAPARRPRPPTMPASRKLLLCRSLCSRIGPVAAAGRG